MKDIRLKEEKRHGLPDFPMQYYFVNADHPRYEMTLHWHREFEIVRVRAGELLLYVDNLPHTLGAGDVAFIGPGMMHRAEPREAVYECVVFDLNMLCRHSAGRVAGYVLPLLGDGVEIKSLAAGESPQLAAAVESLFACLGDEAPYFELKAYACAAEIVYLLYRAGGITLPVGHSGTGHRKQVITALIEWIEANYTEPLTLGALAAVAKTGEKYLCRFFKEYTGSTPIEYINRLRVERACLGLAAGEASITEVALNCGFNDAAYFCKIFKRYKGVTPREYRAAVEQHGREK